MKEKIHPNYHDVQYVCACGNSFYNRSCANGEVVKLDLCNKCHPFFTGQQKIIDSSGRVEKFNKKRTNAENSSK